MPRVVMQAFPTVEAPGDRWQEGLQHSERIRKRRRLAKDLRVYAEQQFGILIGRAPKHHPVDMREMALGLGKIGNPTVEYDWPVGVGALDFIDQRIVQRRNGPVFLRAQAFEPGFAGMDDERRGAGFPDRRCKGEQGVPRLLVVHADAALDCDGNRDRADHRRDAFCDDIRLAHQASAETTALHPVRGTAAVEIDLVIAEIGANPGRLDQPRRIGAAKLQGDRMLARIEADQPLARPKDYGVRCHHLGVEARPASHEAVKRPAASIGPVHHRRHGKRRAVRFGHGGHIG